MNAVFFSILERWKLCKEIALFYLLNSVKIVKKINNLNIFLNVGFLFCLNLAYKTFGKDVFVFVNNGINSHLVTSCSILKEI